MKGEYRIIYKREQGRAKVGEEQVKESFPEEGTQVEFEMMRKIYQHKGGCEESRERTFWAGSLQLSA